MDTTEPTQFTLEGNEVTHIANMDTNETAAEASVQANKPHATPDTQQIEGIDSVENGSHNRSLPEDMDIDRTHINAMTEVNAAIPNIETMPTDSQDIPVHEGLSLEEPAWYTFFSQFQKHLASFGTLDVDPHTNPPLYEWVEEQRKMLKCEKEGQKGSISPERVLLLDALGFNWEGNQEPNYGVQAVAALAAANSSISGTTHDIETFHLRLTQLEEYKSVNGHPNIPENYKENPSLRKWIHEQRLLFRNQSLPQDRVDALTAIGFDFTPADKKAAFETKIFHLKAYKALHGDLNIPRNYPNQGLGEWLWHQKKLYRRWESGREGGMGANRRKILLELGIDFSEPTNIDNTVQETDPEAETEGTNRSTKWDDKFHELREYKQQNGHTNVPRRSKRNPANDALGEWVHFQRRQYRNLLNGKNSTMTIARKKALEVLDFQWSRTGSAFGGNLTNFVDKRTAVRDAVQIQILNAHEEGKTAPWDDRFAQLTEYVQRFGNADVPINYAENLSLGSWVYRQRIAHKIWQAQRETPEESKKQRLENVEALGATKETTQKRSVHESTTDPLHKIPGQMSDVISEAVPQNEQELLESTSNLDQASTAQSNESQVLEPSNVGIPTTSDVQLSSDLQTPTSKIQLSSTNYHIETPQSIIADGFDITPYQSNNEPKFLEVDRMTQERYDKLIAVGFDFEIKKIPDDFITSDGQEPAALILSKTVEEEEKPLIEDEQDVLEISLADEEVTQEVNTHSKQEVEINEIEVSAILNEENAAVGCIENGTTNTEAEQEEIIASSLPILNETSEESKGLLHSPTKENITQGIDSKFDTVELSMKNVASVEVNAMGERHTIYTDEPTVNANDIVGETSHNVDDTVDIDEKMDEPRHSGPNLTEESNVDIRFLETNLEAEKICGEEMNTSKVLTNTGEGQLKDGNHISELNSYGIALAEGNAEENLINAEETKEDVIHSLLPVSTHRNCDQVEDGNHQDEPKPKKTKNIATVQVEWEERVLELIQYKIRKRNCNVPMKWKPNLGLSAWVWRQRDQYRLYRLGHPSILTATRIAKLTELGFEFVVHDHQGNPIYHDESKLNSSLTHEEKVHPQKEKTTPSKKAVKPTPKSRFKEGKWLQSLAKVVAFKEVHGSCNVPRKWKKDPTLGEWVHFQRRQYRLKHLNRRNHMTEERIRKLEAIGFEWSRGTPTQYPRYSDHPKTVSVYLRSPEHQQPEGQVEIPMSDAQEQIVEEFVGCREQAQQIANVVEEQVTRSEQEEVTIHHQVNETIDGKVDQIHQPVQI